MTRPVRLAALAATACGFVAGAWLATDGAPAAHPDRDVARRVAGERSAVEILAELDAVAFPAIVTTRTEAESMAARERFLATVQRLIDLTEELERVAPRHPRRPEWLDRRWSLLTHAFHDPGRVRSETALLCADASGFARSEAFLARAEAAVAMAGEDLASLVRSVEAAEAQGCDRTRVSLLWLRLAEGVCTRVEDQRDILRRLERCAVGIQHVAPALEGLRERMRRVGEPFELAFDDVRDGRRVDLADQRGRAVLLLVWSVTQPDVRATIAQTLQLRDELGADRVALIGAHEWRVEGGAPALRERLTVLGFDAPLRYEEPDAPWHGWVREIGVRGTPCWFLIGPDGRLRFTSREVRAVGIALRACLEDAAR